MLALVIVVVVVVGLLVVASLVALVVGSLRGRRTRELQRHFGAEYDRAVSVPGSRPGVGSVAARGGVGDLEDDDPSASSERVGLRPLDPSARAAYTERWRRVQEGFVDSPDLAVAEADALVAEVLHDRGYPVDDLEARFDLLAVDHPELAEHYRAAHQVQARNGAQDTSTDDLRVALRRYRSLFDELLQDATLR